MQKIAPPHSDPTKCAGSECNSISPPDISFAAELRSPGADLDNGNRLKPNQLPTAPQSTEKTVKSRSTELDFKRLDGIQRRLCTAIATGAVSLCLAAESAAAFYGLVKSCSNMQFSVTTFEQFIAGAVTATLAFGIGSLSKDLFTGKRELVNVFGRTKL